MGACPYTWFKNIFTSKSVNGSASSLRVRVFRQEIMTVDVTLPARSAGWLMDLIPDDVVDKIKAEGIPLKEIQDDLAGKDELFPQKIFDLKEAHRSVSVWLE